eukprot:COSAG01_NODE_5246_length_4387_cov_10.017724_5_plen_170_part_00
MPSSWGSYSAAPLLRQGGRYPCGLGTRRTRRRGRCVARWRQTARGRGAPFRSRGNLGPIPSPPWLLQMRTRGRRWREPASPRSRSTRRRSIRSTPARRRAPQRGWSRVELGRRRRSGRSGTRWCVRPNWQTQLTQRLLAPLETNPMELEPPAASVELAVRAAGGCLHLS